MDMREVSKTTKILVIEGDQTSFQVRKCIAQALGLNTSVELVHASDVSEGLKIMDKIHPDAIIFSENDKLEKEFLLDSVGNIHPPIILQTEDASYFNKKQSIEDNVMYVPFYDTLEGMHQIIVLAAALGEKFEGARTSKSLH